MEKAWCRAMRQTVAHTRLGAVCVVPGDVMSGDNFRRCRRPGTTSTALSGPAPEQVDNG